VLPLVLSLPLVVLLLALVLLVLVLALVLVSLSTQLLLSRVGLHAAVHRRHCGRVHRVLLPQVRGHITGPARSRRVSSLASAGFCQSRHRV
jgi:hypothetical protein